MLSTVQIVTPPAQEPVSLELLREHIRIDQTSDELLLKGYLRSARVMAEQYLSRALITQTLLWAMQPRDPVWPGMHHLRWILELPRSPVQSIDLVTVSDVFGNETEITAASLPVVPPAALLGYKADLAFSPARLRIGPSTPLLGGHTLRQTNLESVQVQFVAGYGDNFESVPQPIIDAIMLLAAFLYEHRGDDGGEMPRAAEWLLNPYRLSWIA
jgi:uncharacterized phiE125 gp8 family phage protein